MKPDLILCGPPARTFSNGQALFATFTDGEIRDGTKKDGDPRMVCYQSGAAVLLDGRGNLHAGPIDFDGAEDLAVAIIEGNSRALTEPAANLRLAIAYLAFRDGVGALVGGKAFRRWQEMSEGHRHG